MFAWLLGDEDAQGGAQAQSGAASDRKVDRRASVDEDEILGLTPLANLYDLDQDKEESIKRLFDEYSILTEFQRLQDLLPSGMYVTPSHESIQIWHGVMFIRCGLYKGGVFKFKLELPDDYPESPPSLHFITDVFHPMVEQGTGRVDLEIWFPDWKSGTDYASCALPRLHRTFATREFLAGGSGTTPLNAEARDLFMKEPAKFTERVQECVRKSGEGALDNPEGSLIQFVAKGEIHDVIFQALKETDNGTATFEERKSMYVEWFCDDFVRNTILKKGRKKKKDKHKKSAAFDFEELRKAEARKDNQGEEDDDDDDEDEDEDEVAEGDVAV